MNPHKRKKETTNNLLISEGYHPWYWWDDDWDYWEPSTRDIDIGDYEYVNSDIPGPPERKYYTRNYIGRFRKIPTKISYNSAHLLINLDSVYSKEVLRQKKIDKILGEDVDIPNTIENLTKKD